MAEIPSLGPPLAGDVLARRRTLPTKPDDVELAGHTVTLRRYSPTDVLELHEMSDGSPVTRLGRALGAYDADELVWRFLAADRLPMGMRSRGTTTISPRCLTVASSASSTGHGAT